MSELEETRELLIRMRDDAVNNGRYLDAADLDAQLREMDEPDLTGNCFSCMAPHSKQFPCIWGV